MCWTWEIYDVTPLAVVGLAVKNLAYIDFLISSSISVSEIQSSCGLCKFTSLKAV